MLVNNELWNHPRCWSEPSRYTSAGKLRPSLFAETAAHEEPESREDADVKNSQSHQIRWENYRIKMFQTKLNLSTEHYYNMHALRGKD
jgi:hypothetical protein